MPLIKPFAALRPRAGQASEVIAPPYDVMNVKEARSMVDGRPYSFLHVSRAEVDLPVKTDPYAPEVYNKARENLDFMTDSGILERDEKPCFYVYRLTMGDHQQTGLAAIASVAAYDDNQIKKHEYTRPAKEDDRVRQIKALNAQTGPVFLVYRSQEAADEMLLKATREKADIDELFGDVRHEIWVIADGERIEQLISIFDSMDALYVGDGHHRSASASRVAKAYAKANPTHSGEEDYNYFLSVIFPDNQVQILDYNRVVKDLNGLSKDEFLKEIESRFILEPSDKAIKPEGHAQFGMYLDGQWFRVQLDESQIPDDPVASLDVSLLSANLIDPVLGIKDQRTDSRIDFVGGIRGMRALEKPVDSGEMAVAFSLYPTTVDALMAVADANEIMPPKSTWFEPKLADGLLSHLLD